MGPLLFCLCPILLAESTFPSSNARGSHWRLSWDVQTHKLTRPLALTFVSEKQSGLAAHPACRCPDPWGHCRHGLSGPSPVQGHLSLLTGGQGQSEAISLKCGEDRNIGLLLVRLGASCCCHVGCTRRKSGSELSSAQPSCCFPRRGPSPGSPVDPADVGNVKAMI